jgi:hypothetical protein
MRPYRAPPAGDSPRKTALPVPEGEGATRYPPTCIENAAPLLRRQFPVPSVGELIV